MAARKKAPPKKDKIPTKPDDVYRFTCDKCGLTVSYHSLPCPDYCEICKKLYTKYTTWVRLPAAITQYVLMERTINRS